MSVLDEFRRRNVFRIGTAYLVASWLLIQVAETLFPLFGFGDTPARIVVIVLAIGFVPALVLAWAFRITPEGLRRETDQSEPTSERTERLVDRLIIILLALALSIFSFDRFVLDPRRDSELMLQAESRIEEARDLGRREALQRDFGQKSIAVLPFVNLGNDAASDFFSDGLAEELLNLLAKNPDLRVISRTSAFSYKDRNVRSAQIASELGVAHILEGSVRIADGRVRVSARLVDAHSERQLWSDTFDRMLDDIFAIQEEIAGAVADRLQVSLLDHALRPRATNADAYARFLQARFLSLQGSPEGYAQAVDLLQQVLAIDPSYLPALDALAGNYLNQAAKGLRDRNDGFRLAEQAANQALAVDPQYAPAYTRLAWIALIRDNLLTRSAQYFQRAIDLSPGNIRTVGDAATLLKSLGRTAECVAADEFVVSRDPVNATGYFNLGGSYLFDGRYADAVKSFQTALSLSPNRVGAHYQIGIALLLSGEQQQALHAVEQEPLAVLRLIGSALVLHAAGDQPGAERALAELVADFEQDAAYNIASIMAFRGSFDAAFEWLNKAVDVGDPGLTDIVADPLFKDVHADPRWIPFLQVLGRSPEQLGTISLELRLPD